MLDHSIQKCRMKARKISTYLQLMSSSLDFVATTSDFAYLIFLNEYKSRQVGVKMSAHVN